MDYHPNIVSINSEYEQKDCSKLGAFQFSSTLNNESDLCSFQTTTTEVDVSLEWLSAFVEECLSTKGSSLLLPLPPSRGVSTHLNKPPTSTSTSLSKPTAPSSTPPLTRFPAVAGKARSKRRRLTPKMSIHSIYHRRLRQLNLVRNKHSLHLTSSSSDPPLLLQQTYWMADSELLLPDKAGGEEERERGKMVDMDQRETTVKSLKMQQQQGAGNGRRCSHCQAQRTPQWRGGPLGPKTLCNACGVRYKKSGRLLPEYRPANSPTFVSFLHSNSHKRVMEMRMMNASSSSTTFPSSP